MSYSRISVHDNEIHSYRMLLPEQTLIFETIHLNKKTDIQFQDVLAYSFDGAGEQNIIFEIADLSIENFVNWYRKHKETQKPFEYGFPIKGITNPDTLLQYLTQESYKY